MPDLFLRTLFLCVRNAIVITLYRDIASPDFGVTPGTVGNGEVDGVSSRSCIGKRRALGCVVCDSIIIEVPGIGQRSGSC